ncbi:hypothetical protein GJAV_G00081800 [Gymnothorax javanicus]|nr:hypothetical protein GJAV_G00081800 [Gymnothorax javanicus]
MAKRRHIDRKGEIVGQMPSLCVGPTVLSLVTFLCGVSAAIAEKHCTAYTEVGDVVQIGSSFRMYCKFSMTRKEPCPGKKSLYINSREVNFLDHNATTSSVHVENITDTKVFTCKCTTSPKISEVCGYDVHAGYPPQKPQNLTCIQNGESGNVTCSWEKGRETHLQTKLKLWVKMLNLNGSAEISSILASSDCMSFAISESWALYSVWVNATNQLGSAVSSRFTFSLNDIVRPLPPSINGVDCSSRHCVLHWDRNKDPQLMQVQCRAAQRNWTTYNFTAEPNSTWSIQNLEPFTLYEVRARCKLMPERGVWSEWSSVLTKRTEEEAPLKKLDVWYKEDDPLSQSASLTVLWKALSKSEAGGRILGYRLEIHDLLQGSRRVVTTNSSAGWALACRRCNVTLTAYNSKGDSPPARMTLPLQADQPALAPERVLSMPHSDSSIAISWQRPATTRPVSGYLVEWYPAKRWKKGHWWKRIRFDRLHTIITENIRPGECYQGAVYALYANWTAGKASFLDVFSLESAPSQGPNPSVNVGGGKVVVSWTEIPPEHWRGCLRKYTIYLERARDRTIQPYGPIDPSDRSYSAFRGLYPGERYNLSMTASTRAGEGYRGRTIIFIYPRQEYQHYYVISLAGCAFFLCFLMVLCLSQVSSVQQRLSMCCLCSMHDIPDPANSKWAKECTAVKVQVTFDYQLSLENSSQSEEEQHTVEVQECHMPWEVVNPDYRSTSPPAGSTTDLCLLLQPNHSPTEATPVYDGQLTFSYIKSFSHESDSSQQTQESKSTDVTVDYISSHGLLADSSEVEVEDDSLCDLNFFPYPQSPFRESVFPSGGKLTLDAVKIDCSFLD